MFLTLLAFWSSSVLACEAPKKINQLETRFGVALVDDYKWMENASDPDLWSWIEVQQNCTLKSFNEARFQSLIERVLHYRKIVEEQNEVTDLDLEAAPLRAAQPLDFESQLQKKKAFYRWKSKRQAFKSGRVFSSALSKESDRFSVQNKSIYGGDLRRIIIAQKSDSKVADFLLVKFFTLVGWLNDETFYYLTDQDERLGGGRSVLAKHTVGTPQSEDEVVYKGKTAVSDITIHQIGDQTFLETDGKIGRFQLQQGILEAPLELKGTIAEISDLSGIQAQVVSFEKANYGELVSLNLATGERVALIPEQKFVLESSVELGPRVHLLIGLKDAAHVAAIWNNGSVEEISALSNGTITYLDHNDSEVLLSYETYSMPKAVYSYSYGTGKLELLAQQAFPIELEAERIFYTTSTGKQGPIWVVKKKGISLTATTPIILYGYGGFRVSITPAFGMYETLPWLEQGGAFAVATIPGSLDYGEDWYQVARVGGRKHSFDSFANAARELISRGWTSSEHLGMMGASNGGTLVAGTLERHSDLFKAAVPLVGVMDILNFPMFTAGKYWTEDFGNPFVESEFNQMLEWSPYYKISRKSYPATMVMTAEFDDRVVPMHSYKYAAKLQEMNTSGAPVFLYNKEWGAHGRVSGSSRESSRFVSAIYTFFGQQLGQ